MEISYRQLKKMDVISITDGKCLGRVGDLNILYPSGEITAIIVPTKRCFFPFFKGSEICIDWRKIVRIGADVILVDLRSRRIDKPHYKEEDCYEKPSNRDCFDKKDVCNQKHGCNQKDLFEDDGYVSP